MSVDKSHYPRPKLIKQIKNLAVVLLLAVFFIFPMSAGVAADTPSCDSFTAEVNGSIVTFTMESCTWGTYVINVYNSNNELIYLDSFTINRATAEITYNNPNQGSYRAELVGFDNVVVDGVNFNITTSSPNNLECGQPSNFRDPRCPEDEDNYCPSRACGNQSYCLRPEDDCPFECGSLVDDGDSNCPPQCPATRCGWKHWRCLSSEDQCPEIINWTLCKQLAEGSLRNNCEACLNKDGVWTAVGCIPTNPTSMIQTLIRIGLMIGGGVALLIILAGSFVLSTSQGDPKKTSEAKEMITSAIIGLVFIIFSVSILQLIGVQILQIPGFGN